MHIDFKVAPKAVTVGSVITQSFKQGCTDGRLIYISFADLIRGKYSIKDLSGPVGIVDTIDNVIDSERDSQSGKIDWSSLIDTMLSLGAFMTINIGIFNLLPLPALDGGRLCFLLSKRYAVSLSSLSMREWYTLSVWRLCCFLW